MIKSPIKLGFALLFAAGFLLASVQPTEAVKKKAAGTVVDFTGKAKIAKGGKKKI